MKVYEFVKIDMSSGEVLEEISYEYEGPVALCGGGNSGTIGFPAYMQDFHDSMLGDLSSSPVLSVTVGSALETLVEGSTPYDGETAYDPDTALTANQTRFDTHDALVTALNGTTSWESAVTTAVTKLDNGTTYPKINLIANDIDALAITQALTAATDAMNAANVIAATDAYEARITPRFLRGVQRFAGGMAEINAVNSSAFIIGMALLENDVLLETNKYDAEMQMGVFNTVAPRAIDATFSAAMNKVQQRNVMMADGVNRLMAAIIEKIQASQQASHLQAEVNRLKIVAKQEQLARDLEIDVLEAFWDLDAFGKATQVLGGIGGGQPIPNMPGKFASTLGGALQGAATGAATGSVVPGVGTAIGAGVGAALGGIIGLTS